MLPIFLLKRKLMNLLLFRQILNNQNWIKWNYSDLVEVTWKWPFSYVVSQFSPSFLTSPPCAPLVISQIRLPLFDGISQKNPCGQLELLSWEYKTCKEQGAKLVTFPSNLIWTVMVLHIKVNAISSFGGVRRSFLVPYNIMEVLPKMGWYYHSLRMIIR